MIRSRSTPKSGHRAVACAMTALFFASACSPALNWREVRPPAADGLVGSFPCKPDHQDRALRLPGLAGEVTVRLWSCQADEATWVLTYLSVEDAAQVPQALRALAAATRGNLEAVSHGLPQAPVDVALPPLRAQDLGPIDVPRMTPQADSRAWRFESVRPDARGQGTLPLDVTAWHFSHGLTVFQASVWRRPEGQAMESGQEAADVFLRGFHFPG